MKAWIRLIISLISIAIMVLLQFVISTIKSELNLINYYFLPIESNIGKSVWIQSLEEE